MKLADKGHLTYCSNIHPGETWPEVFDALRTHLPVVKNQVSPDQPMGIGLRLSNQASMELMEAGTGALTEWMNQHGFYVFTMNGFPYGGFHRQKVKDLVHQPDWTTRERVDYTIRLFDILAQLLPEGQEGGISTSPLSYKPWWSQTQTEVVFRKSTEHLIEIIEHLHQYYQHQGIVLHLDIEPEPDGVIENSEETVRYFQEWLLPLGREKLMKAIGISASHADEIILRHITICYDVCHFAVAYESHAEAIRRFNELGIRIGKIQISSALKKEFSNKPRAPFEKAFRKLDEPTYLHQVIARDKGGALHQYPDLGLGLRYFNDPEVEEWRTHFHVPVFVQSYGQLDSTREDIVEVLNIWSQSPVSNHLEVETYTWEVLPEELQTDINVSIAREMNWVLEQINDSPTEQA